MITSSTAGGPVPSTHAATIADQFTRQASQFAASPALHNEAALDLLVEAAGPRADDVSLDVACGPGSVVCAFARRVRRAEGLDATEAMLAEARRLAAAAGVENVAWHRGDVYALPFAAAAFDIVSCRFAFHHLEAPARRPSPRWCACAAPAAASCCATRSPPTIRPRPPRSMPWSATAIPPRWSSARWRGIWPLFRDAGLPEPQARFYQVPAERERLVAMSFPAGDDRAGLRAMIDASVEGDTMGVNARRDGDTVRFEYPAVVLVAVRGG